jgi:predicted nucleic acid-binding protein
MVSILARTNRSQSCIRPVDAGRRAIAAVNTQASMRILFELPRITGFVNSSQFLLYSCAWQIAKSCRRQRLAHSLARYRGRGTVSVMRDILLLAIHLLTTVLRSNSRCGRSRLHDAYDASAAAIARALSSRRSWTELNPSTLAWVMRRRVHRRCFAIQ